jgi:hypothetical protein
MSIIAKVQPIMLLMLTDSATGQSVTVNTENITYYNVMSGTGTSINFIGGDKLVVTEELTTEWWQANT